MSDTATGQRCMDRTKPPVPNAQPQPYSFSALVELMATLRAPNGCAWDRKQTHESLKPYLLEETYEVLEAIDQNNVSQLKEELGDVLLQVIFHAQIAEEAKAFTIQDVVTFLAEKLIRRHPHVFSTEESSDEPLNAETVYTKWEEIKRKERQDAGKSLSALDGVPQILPALLKAYQIQARAARVGFDWSADQEGLDQAFDKISEEIEELREALNIGSPNDSKTSTEAASTPHPGADEDELGDVLFSLVNVARKIKVNPEDALRRATDRFMLRFRLMEQAAQQSGRTLQDLSLAEMDQLWEIAKAQLGTS